MAKGGAKRQTPETRAGGGAKGVRTKRHPLSAPQREALHRLANKLGLFPDSDGLDDGGRFRSPVLLPANGDVPPRMRSIFGEELAALQRIGSPAHRCHVREFAHFKVYCLPFYYYDGFNALLYLEHKGAYGAAWKEQECSEQNSPLEVLAPGTLVQFQALLREVLEIPATI